MSRPRLLNEDLLGQLEQRIARQPGNPLVQTSPGPEEDEIRATFAAAGVEPPSEAVLWWGWRSGSTRELLPGLGYIELGTAFAGREILRRLAKDAAADGASDGLGDPDYWWNRSWVPILDTGGQPKTALDCSQSAPGLAPLRWVQWDSVGDARYARAFAPSLGEYVMRLIRTINAGIYRYDAVRGCWQPGGCAALIDT